jgi:mRNA interferase MazF
MQRGEIYSLDFGIPRGSVQGGVGPALVIQNDVGNRSSSTTIVAAITSKQKKSYPFHVEISSNESGLPEDSTILLEQIQTVPKNLLVKKIGGIGKHKMMEVDSALIISLGISLSET